MSKLDSWSCKFSHKEEFMETPTRGEVDRKMKPIPDALLKALPGFEVPTNYHYLEEY